jgi:2-oxo-4-hydroxy-4-carboxy-5-ureidoimidazoline decarboxylase
MKFSLDQLNKLGASEFVATLTDIFERSPWVAERVAGKRPFKSARELLGAMTAAVQSASKTEQEALLRAHPDLAGKAARAGTLTNESTAEQASAGLDQLSEREYESFHGFNTSYQKKHGIPFIICVRRHTKGSILQQFEKRIFNATGREFENALAEVFHIAALRLDLKIENAELGLNGRLSTHVLDNHAGRPAKGIWLALRELSGGDEPRLIARSATNTDGRTDAPLISGRPVPIGQYELLFSVADYYRDGGVPLSDPPFLDVVPVRFSVADPAGHYHVPLLVTPWSYSTYRGS